MPHRPGKLESGRSKITEPGEHPLTISPNNVRLPGDVSYSAITVASRNPDTIKLEVKVRESTSVPVVVYDNDTTPDGFFADTDNPELDYEFIQISGPLDVISKIEMARIDVDLSNKKGTVSEAFAYTLCDAEGQPVDAELVTTNAGAVNVTLQVMPIKQIGLSVAVVDGGGATKDTATVELEIDSLSVYGPEEVLQNLNTLELGTVNLGEWLEDTTLVFPIELPEGVGTQSDLSEVIVKVSFPELNTKTLDITNIAAVNVPVGKKAEIVTKTLQITFRGPAALIEDLTAEHVGITVDFTDAQDGTATMAAVISLAEEYASIGAVGTYSVSATLK